MTDHPKACVIGWPVEHSRSPLIHNYWLKHYGLAGSYGRCSVPPEDMAAFLPDLAAQGYVGCNVTLPHKEAAFSMVTVSDEATRRLGVVNTVWLEKGTLHGTSSDGPGFMASLRSCVPHWQTQGSRVVILGAGGTARALAGTLSLESPREITLVNRTFARAQRLAQELGSPVTATAWENLTEKLQTADLLINATSSGMAGQPPLDIDLAGLAPGAVVADVIYVPLETPLLRAARLRGHRVVPGLGMLLHQAVEGFERWFGPRPVVTPELYDLVSEDIRKGAGTS